MKKMLVRAAVLAMFTGGMAITTGIAGAGTALACENHADRSDKLAASLPQVNYGDHNQHVVALQLALRVEGYDLQGTGMYAGNTLAAVQDFQRKNGINPSGIVGSKTWHALVGPKGTAHTGNGEIAPPSFGINPGEYNREKMSQLDDILNRIHPYYTQNRPWEGGTYGPAAQAAVQDFQRRAGINPSGIVGPKTWAAMYEVISVTGFWGC